ncbi:MAG: dicarboxylate/amino acid:cation symporter [Spongiibacteraceae bacterium]|jgi:Na+/H+-dicarboxylate symporter|nr:dicarboxylate/amino acid:cation symporter [Spongiibacteraceae bacterium]
MTQDAAVNTEEKSLALFSGYLTRLTQAKLWLQVLVGMLLGLLVGIAIGPTAGLIEPETSQVVGNWLAFPGRLFLVTIQMIVVPLVFASIIRGLAAGGDMERLKQLGLWVTGFFVVTTAIAAAIGIQLALLIEPGSYLDLGHQVTEFAIETSVSADAPAPPRLYQLPDVVIDLLPENPLSALVEGQMLQIVLFAFVVGVALLSLPTESARPMLELLGSLQEVCMTVVRWAMTIAPFAVFGLMAQLTSRTGWQTLVGLGVYVGTVLLGLLLLLVFYMLFLRIVARVKPLRFLRDTRELLLLAFSTSSSAAVMPLSMKTAVEKFGVRSSVAQFVIPLGATINMNGTALYQAVAAMFLAQVFAVDITTAGMVLIIAMAVGASIGSPATPGVGIVILASILGTIGVPPAGVALIIGVDRLLDMCRTAVNVAGDLVASIFVDYRILGQELRNDPGGPDGVIGAARAEP